VQSWGRSLNGHHTMLDLCSHGLEHHQHSLMELGIENRGSCGLGLQAKGWDGVDSANNVVAQCQLALASAEGRCTCLCP